MLRIQKMTEHWIDNIYINHQNISTSIISTNKFYEMKVQRASHQNSHSMCCLILRGMKSEHSCYWFGWFLFVYLLFCLLIFVFFSLGFLIKWFVVKGTYETSKKPTKKWFLVMKVLLEKNLLKNDQKREKHTLANGPSSGYTVPLIIVYSFSIV